MEECVNEAKPRKRWTRIEGAEISCQGKPTAPCGDKQKCIYCLARAVAATYFGRSREVTYAAIESARRAGWTEADSLSRMILKLMRASVDLGYDKHLSHYGGLTVPVHDLERQFKKGAGTDIFPQWRRSRTGEEEYSAVRDPANKTYAGWLYLLARKEGTEKEFDDFMKRNQELWADAVEGFLGLLELAERNRALRDLIPFRLEGLRCVVEDSFAGFSEFRRTPMDTEPRKKSKDLWPQLREGCSWRTLVEWDDGMEFSDIDADGDEEMPTRPIPEPELRSSLPEAEHERTTLGRSSGTKRGASPPEAPLPTPRADAVVEVVESSGSSARSDPSTSPRVRNVGKDGKPVKIPAYAPSGRRQEEEAPPAPKPQEPARPLAKPLRRDLPDGGQLPQGCVGLVFLLQVLFELRAQPRVTCALGDQKGYWCWRIEAKETDIETGYHATNAHGAFRILVEDKGQLKAGPRQGASNNTVPCISSARKFEDVQKYMGPSICPQFPNTRLYRVQDRHYGGGA